VDTSAGLDRLERWLGIFDRWLAASPRLGPPLTQLVLGGFLVLGGIAGAICTSPWAFIVVPFGALIAYRAHRWNQIRRMALPVIVLTRFAATTERGEESAKNYVSALKSAIERALGELVAVECVAASVTVTQAATMRTRLNAAAVVFGEVAAIDDVSSWTARMSFQMDWDELNLQMSEGSIFRSEPKLSWKERRLRPHGEAPSVSEGPVPLRALMDQPTSIRSIALTVSALTAIALLHALVVKQRPATPIVLPTPDPELPPRINVILLGAEGITRLAHDEDPLDVLSGLAGQARGGLSSREVWTYITTQGFIGQTERWCPKRTTISLAAEAAAANPDYWVAWNNLGYMHLLVKDVVNAEEAARRAREAGAPEEAASFLEGAIAWANDDAETSYARYRVTHAGSRRDFAMADCLRSLGDTKQALALYRRSIAKNPFRQAAVLNARLISDQASVRTPLAFAVPWPFNAAILPISDWRLRHLLKAKGETPGLHTMLGIVALLRGHYFRAYDLLIFSGNLPDWTELDVVGFVIAAGLLGRWDSVNDTIQLLAAQPDRNMRVAGDVTKMIIDRSPRMRRRAEYVQLRDALHAAFGVQLPAARI